MSDPLQRRGSTAESAKTNSFCRGFHAAQSRSPVVNHERTLKEMIVSGALTALPLVLLGWMMHRGAKFLSNPGTKTFSSEFLQSMQKHADPLGRKEFIVKVKDTKFKDVIGVPEALNEVRQYVDFLKMPAKFTRLGAKLPRGCLLTGEPGTGKTLLAKAVAGEADVPFFCASGADFIEVYVGSGPKRVRELFEQAKKAAPSVVFVDEIDAVGSRGGRESAGGVNSEENRTINQLLAELDGLSTSEAIVVFAATNFPDNLDRALLREGRFDRKVEIPMPDLVARKELFHFYLNKVVTGDPDGRLKAADPAEGQSQQDDVTVADPAVSNAVVAEKLAGLTPSVSPATIATIVNEAALSSAVSGAKAVELPALTAAIDDVLVGKKLRNRMSADATARVALHEAGHTTVAWLLPQQTQVLKTSITPRGQAAGYTLQLGREFTDSITKTMLFTDLCVLLGGRAAESLKHASFTTGAADDVQRATQNALNQFLSFGMSKKLGLLSFEAIQRLEHGRIYQIVSDSLQYQAELEAGHFVNAAYDFTRNLLQDNKERLMTVAEELNERKELLADDFTRILGPRRTDAQAKLPRTTFDAVDRFVDSAMSAGDFICDSSSTSGSDSQPKGSNVTFSAA